MVEEATTPQVSKVLTMENSKKHVSFNSVLEPILCLVGSKDASMHQGNKVQPSVCPSRPSNNGPWILDWLSQVPIQEGGKAFTETNINGVDQHSILKEVHENPLVSKQS